MESAPNRETPRPFNWYKIERSNRTANNSQIHASLPAVIESWCSAYNQRDDPSRRSVSRDSQDFSRLLTPRDKRTRLGWEGEEQDEKKERTSVVSSETATTSPGSHRIMAPVGNKFWPDHTLCIPPAVWSGSAWITATPPTDDWHSWPIVLVRISTYQQVDFAFTSRDTAKKVWNERRINV